MSLGGANTFSAGVLDVFFRRVEIFFAPQELVKTHCAGGTLPETNIAHENPFLSWFSYHQNGGFSMAIC